MNWLQYHPKLNKINLDWVVDFSHKVVKTSANHWGFYIDTANDKMRLVEFSDKKEAEEAWKILDKATHSISFSK